MHTNSLQFESYTTRQSCNRASHLQCSIHPATPPRQSYSGAESSGRFHVTCRAAQTDRSDDRHAPHQQAEPFQRRPEDIFPYDLVDDEEKAEVRRKTKILMEILTAGENIEEIISKHSSEIDAEMISLLDKRSKMASRMREGDTALGGLALVKRRLQAELDANQASPSQRLLDTMLDVMQPEPGLHVEEQEEEVERLLRYAFQPPQMPHVDIFETAARLSRGEEIEDVEASLGDFVPQHVFISETEELLMQAATHLKDLERLVNRGNLGKYEAAYTHALNTRTDALHRVRTILELARQC